MLLTALNEFENPVVKDWHRSSSAEDHLWEAILYILSWT